MAEITASMVKELREASGAGMMDCKTALNENDGNMEAAIDWLRTKGLAKAAKKASRVAADGLVGVASSGTAGAVVEVNSETDFVARNETFQGMVTDISAIALNTGGDHDALLAADYPGADLVSTHLTSGAPRLRVGLLPDGRAPAREGTDICAPDGASIGTVTSGGFSPTLGRPVAMGYVATDFADPDTPVHLIVRGRALPARVSEMPFVPHKYVRATT